MGEAAGTLHPVLRIAASISGGVLALASVSTRAAFGPQRQAQFDAWWGVCLQDDLDMPLPPRQLPRSPFGDVPYAFQPAAPHVFHGHRPQSGASPSPPEAVLPAPDDLLTVAALTRRSRSESGGGRAQLADGFWRARDPAAGLLQGLRFEGLVGAPRRNSHAGGLDSPHTAGSASLAAGSSSELTGAPRRPRDAAVNAALDLSRRLTGAGGGSLWQQDPLRGTQHGPAPHLPAHIYQGGASSALYKPLGVLSTMRTAAQALHPSAAGASGTHVQQPSAAKLDAPRVHNSAAKPASPPKVASAPKEQAGSRPWMGNLFGTFGSSATAARQPNRSQSAGLAFRDIIAGVQGAPQPMSSRITLSMEALARR